MKLCVCNCGESLTGRQRLYASNACKQRVKLRTINQGRTSATTDTTGTLLKAPTARILRVLKREGHVGATTPELVRIGGSRFGARIYELRQTGLQIDARPDASGVYRYFLREHAE